MQYTYLCKSKISTQKNVCSKILSILHKFVVCISNILFDVHTIVKLSHIYFHLCEQKYNHAMDLIRFFANKV